MGRWRCVGCDIVLRGHKDEPGEDTLCVSCERIRRIEELEGHRRAWRNTALTMLDLLERMGAMDIHDQNGHTGQYTCCWCEVESSDPNNVIHMHECRLWAMLDRFRETDEATQHKCVDGGEK